MSDKSIIEEAERIRDDLRSALSRLSQAWEDLDSISERETRKQFDHIIEAGFMPGTSFIFDKGEKQQIVGVKSYSASSAGAYVVIEWLAGPNKGKEQAIQWSNIADRLAKFERIEP